VSICVFLAHRGYRVQRPARPRKRKSQCLAGSDGQLVVLEIVLRVLPSDVRWALLRYHLHLHYDGNLTDRVYSDWQAVQTAKGKYFADSD
jgi:hypothetical protein